MSRNLRIIALLAVASFTVFIAFKEFFALRDQVYRDAYLGYKEPLL